MPQEITDLIFRPYILILRKKISYEIYFGLSRPDGTTITETDWDNFVNEEIVPCFPEGFTIVDSKGYWQDYSTNVTIAENSKIVIIYGGFSEEDIQKIIDLKNIYKEEFEQDSVMLVVSSSFVSF
ncbi:DUF3574 domain-containing protein [Methanolacinia petrolearia]|uniref:DUF3574 domain-containing protein n=1 Tax=Methanolacinia petrolearia TaxID=54120 RepID=UPI003BA90916